MRLKLQKALQANLLDLSHCRGRRPPPFLEGFTRIGSHQRGAGNRICFVNDIRCSRQMGTKEKTKNGTIFFSREYDKAGVFTPA